MNLAQAIVTRVIRALAAIALLLFVTSGILCVLLNLAVADQSQPAKNAAALLEKQISSIYTLTLEYDTIGVILPSKKAEYRHDIVKWSSDGKLYNKIIHFDDSRHQNPNSIIVVTWDGLTCIHSTSPVADKYGARMLPGYIAEYPASVTLSKDRPAQPSYIEMLHNPATKKLISIDGPDSLSSIHKVTEKGNVLVIELANMDITLDKSDGKIIDISRYDNPTQDQRRLYKQFKMIEHTAIDGYKLPSKIEKEDITSDYGTLSTVFEVDVKSIRINSDLSAEDFHQKLCPGSYVKDKITGKRYQVSRED